MPRKTDMKSFAVLILCCLLAGSVLACSKGPVGVEETAVFVDPNAVKGGAYGDLFFSADGFDFGIYDPMQDLLDHVSSNTTFSGQSCAFDGDDIYYFFNGFEVMANVIDGTERITAITVDDDTVKTPDGLYIGMPEAELAAILDTTPDVGGIYVTVDGTAQRNVTVQDGFVRAIAYVPAG